MTQPDFTIADVLAWARTKPADETYNYNLNTNCALCQFLRETDRAKRPSVGGHYWREEEGNDPSERRPFPDGRKGLEYALIGSTFGGLVARLEKLVPETIVPPSEWTKLDTYMNDLVMS